MATDKNYNRQYQKRLRAEVITEYGGKCVCCGEDELLFLCLDHISGGGTKERKDHGGGRDLWLELRRKKYPKGAYQVLCANCNQATKHGDICPHRLAERRSDQGTK